MTTNTNTSIEYYGFRNSIRIRPLANGQAVVEYTAKPIWEGTGDDGLAREWLQHGVYRSLRHARLTVLNSLK